MKRGSEISGSATVNIPEEYGVNFNHNGELTEFTNSGTVNVAGTSYTGRSEFSKAGSNLRGSASLRIPQEYSLEFKHEGDLLSFSNDGAVTYDGQKYTGRSRFTKRGNSVSGSASINIPDEYSVTFNHQGDLKSFSNEGSINLAGRRFTGETELRLRGINLNGKAKVNIPEEYSIEITHESDYTDFKNNGIVKLGRRTYSGRSEFRKSGDRIEGSASVNIPEEYGMKFNHEGGLKEFANSGEVKINRDVYSGNSNFRLDNTDVEGGVSVRIPDEYALSFNHKGPITRFNNEATLRIPGRVMSQNTEFSLNGNNVAGQSTVRLPEEYGVSFSHQGPMTSFANEASIRTPKKTYSGNTELRVSNNGVSGNARVNLPREYSIDFNHEGGLKDFNNKATITYGAKKYSANSEFLLKGKKAEGRVVLRIPDMYSIKFSHQGNLYSFSNEASLKAFGQRYTAGSEFRMNGDTVRGTANVRIPEEYKLTFSHNGVPTDFNTNAEAILNGASYTATTTFKKDGSSIESTGQIMTPHAQFKNLEFTYNHEGGLYNFKQDAYAAAGNKRFSAKSEYSLNGNDLSGRLEVATPFTAVRSVLLEVSHEGKMKNFKNSATLEVNDKRYTANGEMKLFGKKKQGTFMVAIPEEYGVSFIHKGASWKDWTNKITSSLGDDRININSGLTIEPTNVEALLSVRTPFTAADNFGFNVNHKGNAKKFTTMAEVNTPIRGYRRFSGELSFEGNGRSFQTNGKIQTPFDKVPEMTFNANHRSQLNNYVSSAFAEVGNKRIAADSAYRKYGKNLEVSLNLQTPWRNLENMGFQLTHNGENGIDTNIKVDTPLQQYKSFGANFNHQGTLKNFQSSARFETPFQTMPVVNVAVNHRGDSRDFTTAGSIEYGTDRIEGETSYKRTDGWYDGSHTGSMRINTPFGVLRNIDLSVEQHIRSDSLNGRLEVSYNSRKYIDGDYTLETGPRKNLMVNIREPKPMSTSLIVERKNNGIDMNCNFNWNTRTPSSNGRVAFNCGSDSGRIFSNGEFMLANLPRSKMSYELESSVASRRYQSIYDGRVKVESSLINWEGTYNHIHSPGRRYVTEVNVGDRRKLKLNSEILVNQPGVKTTIAIGHPSYSNVSLSFNLLSRVGVTAKCILT